LAKTEAQLAITTQTPDSFTPNTCTRRSSQYQLPAMTTPYPRASSVLGHTATNIPMDLDEPRGVSAAIDMPKNGSPLLHTDLFTSFDEGADSNMTFHWTNQSLTALEPLDRLLLNQPQLAHQSGPEEYLSPTDLNLLHNHYFESVYFSFPFLNRDRFVAESTGNGSSAVSALVYAVALAGCSHSPRESNRQSACYNLARNYAERCEREDCLKDLNFLQALLFIGRFEAMSQKLERGWLTLGRAAMICRLLRLHLTDEAVHGQDVQSVETPSSSPLFTADPVILEERRRTFWGLYILQSYLKTRTGWECQLGDVKVRITILYHSRLCRS
jgi:hypothetical protein